MERRRILLVDDNPNDVELALTALQENTDRCDVLVAGSGAEALALLGNPGPLPDLILLDLNMPQMDGLAVLDAVRGGCRTRSVPVVILTTSNEVRDIRASYAHGASAYVIKPLDFLRFREAMQTITAFWTGLNSRPA